MQTIVCKVTRCGYCSKNGFCLNKLTVINQQGVCKYLTIPGWDKPVKEQDKNTRVKEEIKQDVLGVSDDDVGTNS